MDPQRAWSNSHDSPKIPAHFVPTDFGLKKFLLQVILGLAVSALVIYYLFRGEDVSGFMDVVGSTNPTFILLAFAAVASTIVAKTVRWKIIFVSFQTNISLSSFFKALTLGQLVNLLVPLRFGDALRILSITHSSEAKLGQSIASIFVEKSLDLFGAVIVFLLLLATVNLPSDLIPDTLRLLPVALLLIIATIFLLIRYRARRRNPKEIRGWAPSWVSSAYGWSPAKTVTKQIEFGIDSMVHLQSPRTIVRLLSATAFVLVLSILAPFFLFKAFDLSLGFLEATALNLVISIGSIPPSTPAKVLIFESLTILTLSFFGLDKPNLLLGFSVVYHAVVALPLIFVGSLSLAVGGTNVQFLHLFRAWTSTVGQ